MDSVTQRVNEIRRVILNGQRTDDGARCTLIAIRELGGAWALYPHGVGQFGVRLAKEDAATMAQEIQAGAS